MRPKTVKIKKRKFHIQDFLNSDVKKRERKVKKGAKALCISETMSFSKRLKADVRTTKKGCKLIYFIMVVH